MPVYKRKYRSGKVVWYYQFATSGSTRDKQNLITESGFATKQEATAAEAVRHAEELVRLGATGGITAPMPTTLSMLLAEFMKQNAEENLAPKTVGPYLLRYPLDPDLERIEKKAAMFKAHRSLRDVEPACNIRLVELNGSTIAAEEDQD